MTKRAGLPPILRLGTPIGQGRRSCRPLLRDICVSLLPGEARDVTIRFPEACNPAKLQLRGWDVGDRVLPLRL